MTRSIALVWAHFGPYHMDRCEALGKRLRGWWPVHGIEIAGQSRTYGWAPTDQGVAFTKHTLFPDKAIQETSRASRFLKLLRTCLSLQARHVFLPSYDHYDFFVLAVALRLLRRRVYLISVSKFDDKPRKLWRELGKSFALKPYCGALAAGSRSESYLRFLGFVHPVAVGHNTVSVARLLEVAGPNAPARSTFAERYFVVIARFVPKKDVAVAIAAYAHYRELAGPRARELYICGSGPLESAIRRQIADLRLEGVVLRGFLQREGVAGVLSGGLALIIPSVEEQWGLVVNEALAFCLPILASEQIGARDLLVRTEVNGYIFEPGNVAGLARLMLRLGADEVEWQRLVEGSRALRERADSERFADAVMCLLGAELKNAAEAKAEVRDLP